jgi:predicted  nucleic acid-binding Zn-ribbon protein
MTLQVSPVIKVDDKKIRQLEGLYKQLQDQFEEKARVLSQTRKDLFHTEGKLLAFEHEKELSAVTPNHESAYFEKEFCRLAAEIASLEEEVAALEDLTSSLFY